MRRNKTKNLSESEYHNIVKRIPNRVIAETSRRQKAQQAIDGKRVKTLLIMSAENPMGKQLQSDTILEIPRNNPNPVCTAVSNKERTNLFANMLEKQQFCYFPVKGKYENIEYSYIVYNISLDDAKRFGRYFDQRDIIFGKVKEQGVVAFYLYRKDESEFANVKDSYRDYHHTETKNGYLPIDSNANDYYTAIGRHNKFSIPFDAYMSESLHNIVSGLAFVNEIVEDRSRKHWSYAKRYNRNLNESISDTYTPWGRRQRRADLWGKNYEIECNAYERYFPRNNTNS